VTQFDWDPPKAEINRRKHKVPFSEAQTVVDDDPMADVDERHGDEPRFRLIGYSRRGRLLVVIVSADDRVISARRATKHERDEYARRR
jgi:uncharacterized protein